MSLVRLENVTKRFGGEPILDSVSFRVEETDKVGLIGRNGTGKSTLFRLITGEAEPDGGVIERMRRARVACLSQLPRFSHESSIRSVVMASFQELVEQEGRLERLEKRIAEGDEEALAAYGHLQDAFRLQGGYEFRARAKRVLTGLGFADSEFDLPVTALSGGQRTRLLLALVLLQDADLLLLDEPENHLDIRAREWLESFLKERSRAFVVISHDRRLLDETVYRIVEVERGRLSGFTGNYQAYIQNKALVREQQERAYQRQQSFIEKEQRWIERFRYKNTKARQVQSRIKRLEKLECIEAPLTEAKGPHFALGETVRTGQVVLDARGLGMGYGSLRLYENLSFEVQRGERIGIAGPNGCGKTTLLRHLAGRQPGGTGEVRLGVKVSLGFYDQHHESLNSAADVFSEIRSFRPSMLPEEIRTFLGKFLFSGEDVFKPIAGLSGGELSRLALAKLMLSEANVLLLDEPTNHLDISSREALELALESFPGTILLVTHDRALIDRLVNRLIVFDDGNASIHLGNYAEYHARQEVPGLPPDRKSLEDPLRIRSAKKPAKRARNRETEIQLRRRRKELEQLEDLIAATEETIAALEAESARLDPGDFGRAREIKASYEDMKADLRELYAEWERLAEEIGAS